MFTYLHCLQIFDISLLHCFIMMIGYFVLHCSAGVPCALCLKWGLEVIFHAPLPSPNSFPFSPSSFYCSGFSLFVSFLLPNFLLEVVASLFFKLLSLKIIIRAHCCGYSAMCFWSTLLLFFHLAALDTSGLSMSKRSQICRQEILKLFKAFCLFHICKALWWVKTVQNMSQCTRNGFHVCIAGFNTSIVIVNG